MEVKKLILRALSKSEDGLTIQNLMDKISFSRGTIKTNLLYLIIEGKVREIAYTKNSKVYKMIR